VSNQVRESPAHDSVNAPAGSRPRLAGLDGVRGLACLCVILAHVMVHYTPRVLAQSHLDLLLGHSVTLFFVLSAFLLYLPYVKRLDTGGQMPSPSMYLRRRVLRVFPAYLVIFMVANFVLRAVYLQNPFTVGWSNGDQGTGMMTDPVELLANLTLTQTLFPNTLQTGINPSWTLTVEWGFYLVLPVIGLLLAARVKSGTRGLRAATVPVIALFAVGITTQTVVAVLQKTLYPDSILASYWGTNWTAVLSRSSFSFATVFAAGMGAAVMYVALSNRKLSTVSTLRLQLILACVVLLGGTGALVLFRVNPHYVETAVGLAAGAFILLIVVPIARGRRSAVASVTDWLPLRYFGVAALSAYLWHYPVLILVGRSHVHIPDSLWGTAMGFVMVAGGTAILAWATYRFVEKPAMRFGE
jgi:peptidoglycan/LPS O-acetylase OafA/YrhL